VCEVLKHADVDVNSTNNDGDTALHLAIRNGHFKIATELLKHKEISVNASNKNGDSALFMSIMMGNLDVIQELLKHEELDMVAKTKSGDTALCVARKCGNEKIIRLLEDGLSRRLLESIKKEKRRVQDKKEPQHVLEKLKRYRRRDDQDHVDIPPVKKLTVAQRSRELLYHVMTTPASDPIELPYE
jgi:ankyrin repeat protein